MHRDAPHPSSVTGAVDTIAPFRSQSLLHRCSSPASRQDHHEQPWLEKGADMCQFKEWVTLIVAVASFALDVLKTLKARRGSDEPPSGPDT